jgi:hypothetical protein
MIVNNELPEDVLFFLEHAKFEEPDFIQNESDDWISAGINNRFFDELIEYSNYSPIHHSILQSKINLVSGNKIEYIKKEVDFNLDELIDKITTDFEIIGACAFEIIRNSKNDILNIEYLPLANLRYQKEIGNKILGMYYSDDWFDDTCSRIFIPFYNSNEKQPRSIKFIKRFWSASGQNVKYQILPSYTSAIPSLDISYKIDNFHNSNLDNNMTFGMVINIIGQQYKDPTVAKALREKLEEKYSGSSNSGKTLVTISKSKEESTTIDTIDNPNLDKMFEVLNKTTRDKIIESHQITSPKIVGIQTPGELGGSGLELLQSYQIFLNQVIEPDRKLIQNMINDVLYELDSEIKIIYENTALVTFLPETILTSILSINELRSLVGLSEQKIDDNSIKNENNI